MWENRILNDNDLRTDIRTKLAVPYSTKTELCAKADTLVVDTRTLLTYNNSLSSTSVEDAFLYTRAFLQKKKIRSNKID